MLHVHIGVAIRCLLIVKHYCEMSSTFEMLMSVLTVYMGIVSI